ncbi:hypothetical protein MBLNU457_6515t1 [Dothideomycetes sp. NU457]
MRPTTLRSAIRASIPKPPPSASRALSTTLLAHPRQAQQPHRPTQTHLSPILTTRPYSTSTSLDSSSPPSAVQAPDYLNDAERSIFNKIASAMQPTRLEVQDISGGCGSMYALDIVSARFKGLSVIKQHRLVNEVLEQEIKGWHGVQLKTKAP